MGPAQTQVDQLVFFLAPIQAAMVISRANGPKKAGPSKKPGRAGFEQGGESS